MDGNTIVGLPQGAPASLRPLGVHPPGPYAAHDREVEELLAAGERALHDRGDLLTARRHFHRAAALADAVGDDDALGRAVLGWSGMWVHEHRGVLDAARLEVWRAKARQRVDAGSVTGLRLSTRAAAETDYVDGTHDRVDAALAQARRSGDPVLLAEALSLTHHCMLGPEHAERRLRLADELLALALTDGRDVDALIGVLWRTVDLFLDGHAHAERCLAELRDLAARGPHLAAGYVAAALDVMLAIREGRLENAERLAGDCYELGQRAGDSDALGWYGAQLCAIRWYQGRTAELTDMLAGLVSSATLGTNNEAYWAGLAVCAASAGQRDRAERALARLREPGLTRLRSSSSWLVALLGVAEAAYLLQDPTAAEEAYRLLAPYADRPVMASLGIACFGSAHYPLALAALTCGDVGTACRHLEQAISHNRVLGNGPAARMAADKLDEVRSTAAGRHVSCSRAGAQWVVHVDTRAATVTDCLGIRYLAMLIGRPGAELRAVELAGLHVDRPVQQRVLDRRAVSEYRSHLATLREVAEEARANGDVRAAADAQREYDAVTAELTRASGLTGRARAFTSGEERARTSVQKAIKRALVLLRDQDRLIAETIEARLSTGLVCCYRE